MSRNNRRRQRGFIIIFGTRTMATRDGRPPVDTTCPSCRQPTRMVSKRMRQWFTLFFLPVIPMSSGQNISECELCKARFAADVDMFRPRAAQPQANNWQAAIALFNQMRETPGDSARLRQLMTMYHDMGEYREAVSAARAFPNALQSNPECINLLNACEQKMAASATA